MDEVNITVIGAGVVGLAIASGLSKTHSEIIVVEKHDTFGQETSSRNSEVIHSGIYYPFGSLKARLCVRGADMLYHACRQLSIPHRKIGKLIVATEESEVRILEDLLNKGLKNEVRDLSILQKKEIDAIEPHTNARNALFSPNTGIIDSHAFMKSLYHQAHARGVLFSFGSEINLLQKDKERFTVGIKQDDYRFRTRVVINCAGLASDHIAGLAGIDIQANEYALNYCKGSYFSYAKASPVNMLIYPVPHDELVGLGIHATLDLGGRLRFGPDAEYIEEIDYKIDASKRKQYYQGASKIIPGLEEESFLPDMVGIRPKLSGPGEKVRDFIIRHEAKKGLSGLINLIGIESPGLTAAPAIADFVATQVADITG